MLDKGVCKRILKKPRIMEGLLKFSITYASEVPASDFEWNAIKCMKPISILLKSQGPSTNYGLLEGDEPNR